MATPPQTLRAMGSHSLFARLVAPSSWLSGLSVGKEGQGVKVVFEVSWDCDLKEKTLVGNHAEVSFSATDWEMGVEFQRKALLEEGQEHLPIEDFLLHLFSLAFRNYGFEQRTHYWGDAYYPTHHGEGLSDGDATLAEVDWWRIKRKPRKRRWGEAMLRGECEWDEVIDQPPNKHFNPATKDLYFLSGDCYLTDPLFSSFSEESREWTRSCISKGLEVAQTTLAFYEKMASLYEEKTGEDFR